MTTLDLYEIYAFKGYTHIPDTLDEFDKFNKELQSVSGLFLVNSPEPLAKFINVIVSPSTDVSGVAFSQLEQSLVKLVVDCFDNCKRPNTSRNEFFKVTGASLNLPQAQPRDEWLGYDTCYPIVEKEVIKTEYKIITDSLNANFVRRK